MIGEAALTNFLAAYFHEDFSYEYSSPLAAVDDFARGEPEDAPKLRAEVNQVLSTVEGDGQLAARLHALGLYYIPTADGWPSYREWLLAMCDRVDTLIEQS